jgi:hypothetical protein
MVRLSVEKKLDIFDGLGVWNRYSFYRGLAEFGWHSSPLGGLQNVAEDLSRWIREETW